MQRTDLVLVVGAGDGNGSVLGPSHLDGLGDRVRKRTLRALDLDSPAVDRDVDTARYRDGQPSDSRPAVLPPLLPDVGEACPAHSALAGLPTGHQARQRP